MTEARMTPVPMVHVRTVQSSFQARVIAARLGCEGIATQLRGNISGLYPIGGVSVWVAESDAEEAAELLLADEVESAFDVHPDDEEPRPPRNPLLLGMTGKQLVAAVVLLAVIVCAGVSRLNLF